MDQTDAAFIAGFFDGEGYLTIRRANKRTVKHPSYTPVLGFTNTDLPILRWIQTSLGGGTINPKVRKNIARHSPAWELTITKREVLLRFMSECRPFIRIKQRQCEITMALLDMGKMKRVCVASRGKRWPLFQVVPGEVERREDLKQEMTKANMRGPIAS